MKIQGKLPPSELPVKKPDWFKIKFTEGERYQGIQALVKGHGLATVCSEARCPNIYECWNSGTATFMLMGDTCTRACKFCHVKGGKPNLLDPEEPQKLAHSVQTLALDYVVLTSVNRDDLEDEGADHFARCVEAIKAARPQVLVETLTPDFRRTQEKALERMIASGVDVLAHNVETVRRLVPSVRDPRCRHEISLDYHRKVKALKPSMITKSSIMLGLGETFDEVVECLKELSEAQVEVVTLGQYLQPTKFHHPVIRYVPPSEFKALEEKAYEFGFRFVASGPMVRSSYRAAEVFIQGEARKRQQQAWHSF